MKETAVLYVKRYLETRTLDSLDRAREVLLEIDPDDSYAIFKSIPKQDALEIANGDWMKKYRRKKWGVPLREEIP